MERPSHMAFNARHFSHRLPLIGLALSFQLAAVWIFTQGLMGHWVPTVSGPFKLDPIVEKEQPRVKPPEPNMKPVPIPPMPDPISGLKFEPQENKTITTGTLLPEPGPVAPHPAGVTQGPIGIIATHTVPPYPPIARRLGVEGKVTLRLTVSAEGRVSNAEIVTSSGRDELDQAAEQWIMAHWTYKPALTNGVAVVSKMLTTVTFSLTNER